MKETKADAIDAAPTQIHHEVAPQGKMRSEASEELIGAAREPYGPGGTFVLSDALTPSCCKRDGV